MAACPECRRWSLPEFQRAVRPIAYDVVHGRDHVEGSTLLALCAADELRAIIAHPPAEADRFCPRCAAGYEPGVDACAECDGVMIVAA
jgi:hypothetical protein